MSRLLILCASPPPEDLGVFRPKALEPESDEQSATLHGVGRWLGQAPPAADARLRNADATAGWLCCADLVSLEATMDELKLHCPEPLFDAKEQAAITQLLSAVFADSGFSLTVFSDGTGLILADGRADLEVNRLAPDRLARTSLRELVTASPLPRQLRTLEAEIQMALHDCEVNRQRQLRGQLPINGLWFWGGSRQTSSMLQSSDVDLPYLLSAQASLCGWWQKQAPNNLWVESLAALLATGKSAVIEIREPAEVDTVHAWLRGAGNGLPVSWITADMFHERTRQRWWQRLSGLR